MTNHRRTCQVQGCHSGATRTVGSDRTVSRPALGPSGARRGPMPYTMADDSPSPSSEAAVPPGGPA
eukprot:167560-Hanusia_phi.AAC.1